MTPSWLRALGVFLVLFCLWVPGRALADNVEAVLSPGPVTQSHAKAENDCRACHIPFERKAQDKLCAECHKDVGRDVAGRTGFHGRQKPEPCRSCHTDHKGRGMNIVKFDPKSFDHTQSDYLLKGKHKTVACEKCHTPGKKYSAAPHDCLSCHKKDDVHKGSLGPKCADCHDEQTWKAARFDHDTTDFPLTGAHKKGECADCHKSKDYKNTPKTCVGCHRKEDMSNKGHKGQFGEKCESCHTTQRWDQITFRHDRDADYPLLGRHREAQCSDCHTKHLYRDKVSKECVSCHKKDDKHDGSLGDKCGKCHNEQGWKKTTRFDHDTTRFPLLGKHAAVKCTDCHTTQVYRGTPLTCIGCHRKDDKHANTLGEKCGDCHTESSWKAPLFNHAKTRFPLRGGHAAKGVTCNSCHKDAKSYRNTPTRCIDCHKKDDKHEGQVGDRCESCHNDTRWTGVRYDHALSRFPLAGAHLAVKCTECHKSPRYRDAPRDCFGCHQKDDVHKSRFGSECSSCHNVRAWRLWKFDHDRQTDFKLESGHAKVRCEACHTTPAPAKKPIGPVSNQCVSCHAKDDVHDRSFGSRCEQCHRASKWSDITNQRMTLPPQRGKE